MSAPAATPPAGPLLRLEVVSKVGCVWCVRLKEWLGAAGDVEWFESACLDPEHGELYASQRQTLLARGGGNHTTFPFVFDADSGGLVGGYEATREYVEMHRLGATIRRDDEDF